MLIDMAESFEVIIVIVFTKSSVKMFLYRKKIVSRFQSIFVPLTLRTIITTIMNTTFFVSIKIICCNIYMNQ